MSASRGHARDLRRGSSVLPEWFKEAVRATLGPVVRLAIRLGITPNTITVIGLLITLVASVLVANGHLLVGAAILTAGSLLDAVDGALARATGGGTAFGGFLDSTLDRAGEAILYIGIGAWLLATRDPETATLPMLALLVALAGSFLVSYAHARAEGIGLAANVGLAPRTERLVLVIVGVALAGLGFEMGLIGALVVVAALTVATVIQRIWHVWRLSQAPAATPKKEN